MLEKKLKLAIVAGFVFMTSTLMAFRSDHVSKEPSCLPLPPFSRCPVVAPSTNPHLAAAPSGLPASAKAGQDTRLAAAYRFERAAWIYVHLEGSPEDIGYQHGYLLAPEIGDAFDARRLVTPHDTARPWEFFRAAAKDMLWPHIDAEYQAELKGITAGVQARGVKLDLWDVLALNAFEELPDYYVPWYNEQHKVAGMPKITPEGNCSAFVATGSWTRDHQIVIAHNNWTNSSTASAGGSSSTSFLSAAITFLWMGIRV